DVLQPTGVIGGEQPEAPPFTWLKRGAPQPQQVALRGELARPSGLAGADVVDGLLQRSLRDMGGHGDEIFHSSTIAFHGGDRTREDPGRYPGHATTMPGLCGSRRAAPATASSCRLAPTTSARSR